MMWSIKLVLLLRGWVLFGIFARTSVRLDFLELFHFCHEFFGRFESRNIMFGYMYRNILFDVAAYFGSPFFSDKAAETADIDIFASGKGVLYFLEHSLDRKS